MFVGIAPLRISFAGGGTDMPEYYEKYGGCVVSSNINLFTHFIFNQRHDDSFQAFASDFETHHEKTNFEDLEPKLGTEIAVSAVKLLDFKQGGDYLICSDVLPGSGLGASSTLAVNCVNTISTLKKKYLSKQEIAETAFHIERDILQHPIGKQDDYIAAYGGFNFIKFDHEKVSVTPINLSNSSLSELEENLMLFFVGNTRKSSDVLSNQLQRVKEGNQETLDSLGLVKKLGEDFYEILKNSDLSKVGEFLHNGWCAKKRFTKGVTNERIDKIYDSAIKAGAMGGKITGAGGGGHMLFYCERSKQNSVKEEMHRLGLKFVDFKFHMSGPKVLNLYDLSK